MHCSAISCTIAQIFPSTDFTSTSGCYPRLALCGTRLSVEPKPIQYLFPGTLVKYNPSMGL